MPKLKTNKAVKKRFRITKNGKVLSRRTLRRHMMTDRSPKKKRQGRGWRHVDEADAKHVTRALPYQK